MSSRIGTVARMVRMLVWAGLVAWGVIGLWRIRQAGQAGGALADALTAGWPEQGGPQLGIRDRLLAAARHIRDGNFSAAEAEAAPPKPPSAQQKAAAQRFFARAADMRKRFLAAAAAALAREKDGADVSVVRDALARALLAAARDEEAAVAGQIRLAETALDGTAHGGGAATPGGGPGAILELIRKIGPSFNLGRELMTEGHPAADKLMSRASWHCQARQYNQAALQIRLAAGLLAVELPSPAAAITPKWFDSLARAPAQGVAQARAAAAVEMCEAMAASAAPAGPVRTLVQRARRELDAGRRDEAYWWACVALNALGMSDQAIASAIRTPGPTTAGAEPPR